MADTKIGSIFAEIDISPDKINKSLNQIKRDASVVVLDVENNFKTLGLKSSEYFDLMRAKANNAYQGIMQGAKSTQNDMLRASSP